MELTTEENSNPKEERGKLILKEIENNFKQLTKNSPSDLKEEIQTSLEQFNTLTQGTEKGQPLEKLDILNSIINKTSDKIKKYKNINEETKKYMQEIKKSMYRLNVIENKPSYIRKEYHNGKYEGDYLDGKREGKGIYKYNSGDKYEGEYKNDLKDGYGIYKYSNGDVYEGNYKEGYFEGKGIYKYAEGDIYTGYYKKDLRDGQGTYIYSNGNKYEGLLIH